MRKRTGLILVFLLMVTFLSVSTNSVAAQDNCNRSPMQPLAVGDRVRILNSPSDDPLHTRLNAGLNGGYTGQLVDGDIVTITDGPICLDNYRFWEISGAGESGWVRDGRDNQLWLERVSSSSNNSTATSDSNAANNWSNTVTTVESEDQESQMRVAQGYEIPVKTRFDGTGSTITTLNEGDVVTVLETIQEDGITIARIRYGSRTGWVLLSDRSHDYFEPVDD